MTPAQTGMEVALCAKAVITAQLACTRVILSGGSDVESWRQALAMLDEVGTLVEVAARDRDGERGAARGAGRAGDQPPRA